jgi:hypothetical protein
MGFSSLLLGRRIVPPADGCRKQAAPHANRSPAAVKVCLALRTGKNGTALKKDAACGTPHEFVIADAKEKVTGPEAP